MGIEEAWEKLQCAAWVQSTGVIGASELERAAEPKKVMTTQARINAAARDLALASYNQVLDRAVDIVTEYYGSGSDEFYLVDRIIQVLEEERGQIQALGAEHKAE